ncbi:MAG: sigma-70 family RNA polymerase sigma factor [Phenylobacterium sp.]|uniref:RNA polymerase sigma factor n=1 Tax=Phenylobacterium sp. TaxID=1871053 RepID=UPI0027232EF6|nr:sigma-70 family RNA polymerase sigma factor [Phenylobacterium sp.]MDO8411816.1 sigma-70 family RNA polymerase sigma factor [Phenylobacterium sp.]
MIDPRAKFVAWVGAQILPHEADVRRWLSHGGWSRDEIDDIVQDAYCRIAALASIDHIQNGRAYLFQTIRSVVTDRLRQARVVSIARTTELATLDVLDHAPSAERVVAGRLELRRVQAVIQSLPERCSTIFMMRRVDGLSQREIARRLGVTENVVEAQAARGLRLILTALTRDDGAEEAANRTEPDVRRTSRKRD